jgi:hypothetical protein
MSELVRLVISNSNGISRRRLHRGVKADRHMFRIPSATFGTCGRHIHSDRANNELARVSCSESLARLGTLLIADTRMFKY